MFTSVGAHGHFRPMAPLAQALRAAGHDVIVATAESFRKAVEDLGLELLPVGITDGEAGRRLVAAYPEYLSMSTAERSRRVVVDLFVGVLTPATLADLPRLVDWAPDIVVREEGEFAGPIVAAKVGVPWVDHGWGPMRPPEMVAAAAAALEPMWRAHGLAPGAAGGAYRWLYLDPCPPSLQFPYAADVEVARPVRPEIARSRRPPSELDWIADVRRPIVYVTLGTVPLMTSDLEFFQIAIAALAGDVELVITVGPRGRPDALDPVRAGVHVERFISQAALLPHCALLISNGGAGSTLGALAAGVPVLAVPASPPSQRRNADALVACGAGRRLERHELSVERMRAEAGTMLSDPSYRAVAQRIAAEIVAMPGVEHAARLVGTARPRAAADPGPRRPLPLTSFDALAPRVRQRLVDIRASALLGVISHGGLHSLTRAALRRVLGARPRASRAASLARRAHPGGA